MRSSIAARTVFVSLAALAAATALHAQAARETVYFTKPSNTISRALFGSGTSQTAVTDNGTNLNGLAARYDGNDVVTLLAANTTQGGDLRAYRCASPMTTCQKLGVVAGFKKANGVALDTFGNLYAVNAHLGGADQLIYLPRKPTCPSTTGTGLPAGCFPGGYGPSKTIDSQVDGVTLIADVKVASGTGDVIVLASKPARLLRYSGAAVQNYIENGGTQPSPSTISSNFSGQEPAGLALFPTGEIFVVTAQGSVYVFNGAVRNTFTTLNGQGVQVATSVLGGASADPVVDGRVLVTVKGSNQVQSFGIARVSGDLVASPSVPDGTVPANVPFGVADASLSGSVFTPASAVPLVVRLPIGHTVTFTKVNVGGNTQGNFYIVSEVAVRAAAPSGSCGLGEKLTLESVTRCIPSYVRGFPLDGSTCLNDGTGSGCFYLVFVADTGANVFGSTQEHHFEEGDFGFVTTCYVNNSPGAAPAPKQPRTFHATDGNDPVIVEGDDLADISTGCNSHIGRGGEFSMFLTGWDNRLTTTITTDKLSNLSLALNGVNAFAGGLAPYVSGDLLGDTMTSGTLAYELDQAQIAWGATNAVLTVSHLDAFIALVQGNPLEFTECPLGLPCRNVPGELVARAESAAFLACGAKENCQRTLP